MRKILFIVGLSVLVGCHSGNRSYRGDSGYSEDSVSVDSVDASESISLYYTLDDMNRQLDSLNAKGYGILQRGADRNYDTIIDHVHYIYTTEK